MVRHVCRKERSVVSDTIFYRTHLPLLTWFYVMLLFGNSTVGVRGSFLRRHLGIDHQSSIRVCRLVRLHMAAYDRPRQIGGPGKTVYIDETFVKRILSEDGTRYVSVIVLGFACEDLVISGIIANRSQECLRALIERHVAPGSHIVTDGFSSYLWIGKSGWKHTIVLHTIFWTDFQGTDLNRIETYWRVLKRSLASHRKINIRYLWLYIAEIEFRYNHRHSAASAFDVMISYFLDINPIVRNELEEKYDWRNAL